MTVPVNLGSLVVGYGNPLRSDDGVGWKAAGRMATDPRFAGAQILQCHQLTPELALDISRADLVVFVDARSGPPAGTVAVERVDRVETAAAGRTTWSHHLGPADLVALSRELYGRAGDVHVVSVGVGSLEVGEDLSPAVEGVVEDVIDTIAGLVRRAASTAERSVASADHA